MGVKVTISFQGLDTVLNNLSSIGEKAPANLERQTRAIAMDAEDAWKGATPVRTGRLMGGDQAEAAGLSIIFRNSVYYYKFVNEPGHMTPMGWHTKHGYRPAKRRSHVAGHPMTETLVEFLEDNIEEYLSRFLDGA